jgi:hypothetical protein
LPNPCAATVQSRRNEEAMNRQKVTVLYERLSVEDDRDTELSFIHFASLTEHTAGE